MTKTAAERGIIVTNTPDVLNDEVADTAIALLLNTLRQRELDAVGTKLQSEHGLPYQKAQAGEHVAGIYRQRIALTSGRFAMIDNGLGFQLVPWTPPLEKKLGQHIAGVAKGHGGIEWSLGRQRGLGL